MSRKLVTTALIALLLVAMLMLLVLLRPRGSQRPAKLAVENTVRKPSVPDLGPATLPVADPSVYADLNSTRTLPRQDVLIVAELIRNFQQSLKTPPPPLGFNEEITRALTGRNTLELAFIPSNHPAVNRDGLLCDRWGTPFHFHPVAGDRIDVRSAGPDKKLFTADDVVSAAAPPVSQTVDDRPAQP